ncbi:hypothetical protein C8Q76DRAFT_801057 [Earliella scabrosa]|nr:hypothetical protein C8Q76DRAFT_801057 [Earliella scabrosa]
MPALNLDSAKTIATERTRVADPDGELVVLPNRDGGLPKVWRTNSHVLLEHVRSMVRNVYIVLMDISPGAMQTAYDFADGVVLPDGTRSAVDLAGWLRLGPGDALFARDKYGTGKAEDDIAQVWIAPQECLSADQLEALKVAQAALIGEPAEISPEKAKWDGSKYTGGIAFERSRYAVSVEENSRTYTLAQSYQVQRNITGPCAAAPVGIRALEFGPRHISEALRLQADLVSLPRVGCVNNYAFPTMQLNIASARHADEVTQEAFKSDLGQFAGKHIDARDSPGGVTTMITLHKLEPDEDPGFFMIAGLGVAIEQGGLGMTCFSGLLHHGGFPPTSAPGKEPSPKSVRFVVVLYPSQAAIEGASILTFAKSSPTKLFNLTPEMLHPLHDNHAPLHTSANWLVDGAWLSDRAGYLQTVYQGMAATLEYFARQVPRDLGFAIDHTRLRDAFSLKDESGSSINPREWTLHPSCNPSQTKIRSVAATAWETHKSRMSKFIPLMAITETRANPVSKRLCFFNTVSVPNI